MGLIQSEHVRNKKTNQWSNPTWVIIVGSLLNLKWLWKDVTKSTIFINYTPKHNEEIQEDGGHIYCKLLHFSSFDYYLHSNENCSTLKCCGFQRLKGGRWRKVCEPLLYINNDLLDSNVWQLSTKNNEVFNSLQRNAITWTKCQIEHHSILATARKQKTNGNSKCHHAPTGKTMWAFLSPPFLSALDINFTKLDKSIGRWHN